MPLASGVAAEQNRKCQVATTLMTPPKELLMGLDDLTNQAKDFLKSDQAENISDKGLDGAADFANKVTGDKFADHVAQARKAADGAIGNERKTS